MHGEEREREREKVKHLLLLIFVAVLVNIRKQFHVGRKVQQIANTPLFSLPSSFILNIFQFGLVRPATEKKTNNHHHHRHQFSIIVHANERRA